MADDFCKFFDKMTEKYTLKSENKRPYHRDSTMSKAEIMLIMILFHDSGYRCLKHFYLEKVCKHLRGLFPKVVSYNRFVELEREVAVPLALFIKKVLLGRCTGISFVDSTLLRVCRNQRIHIHKTFKGIAQRGKCSMGWFFGFKLHLICNEKGELLNFMITPGDVDDRKPLEYKSFMEFIYGKLVGDKGYVGKELFQKLFVDGIQLITKLKSNMKGALMSVSDKLLLRKRAIIETVNDELKNIAQVEHSRHRSFDNFIVNMLGAIAAYCMFPKKPCINVQRTLDTQLTLFRIHRTYVIIISLFEILDIVVPDDEIDFPIQSVQYICPFRRATQTEIAQVKDNIIHSYYMIPVRYKGFVHLIHILERTTAKIDDVSMVEVSVRCKEHLCSVKFVIHNLFFFCTHHCVVNN